MLQKRKGRKILLVLFSMRLNIYKCVFVRVNDVGQQECLLFCVWISGIKIHMIIFDVTFGRDEFVWEFFENQYIFFFFDATLFLLFMYLFFSSYGSCVPIIIISYFSNHFCRANYVYNVILGSCFMLTHDFFFSCIEL